MWAIKILTGPQAGQIVPLPEGKHTLGRGSLCDVKIASTSVSKEHATILITNDKIILSDLDSRNGTFVNGVRIQNQRLNPGDKLGLHDVLLDVLQMSDQAQIGNQFASAPVGQGGAPAWAGNAAVRLQQSQAPAAYEAQFQAAGVEAGFQPQMHAQMQAHGHEDPVPASQPIVANDIIGNIHSYIDNVAMPGIYAIAKNMPYRWSIGMLVGLYVVSVTALSIIPVVATTKSNIQSESVRRAKSIANNMRENNKKYILNRNSTSIDITSASLEEGVTAAFIIDAKDGTVLAPVSQRGEFVNKPFVNQARRADNEFVQFIDDSTLGVSVPITAYNPETGAQGAAAYAMVLYDVGSLAMTPKQQLSLFVQTLAISLLAGLILFYFLYKLVEHPIVSAGDQLDDALREGRDDLHTDYHYPALERLISNVNSALSRIGQPSDGSPVSMVLNRDHEARNIVRDQWSVHHGFD
ncbi:MAG: FHA domain-containing protein [Proteobacteria bacterium]|nr:MAG: FHA domain-containing protein [Pseudomonadota bacterium]